MPPQVRYRTADRRGEWLAQAATWAGSEPWNCLHHSPRRLSVEGMAPRASPYLNGRLARGTAQPTTLGRV